MPRVLASRHPSIPIVELQGTEGCVRDFTEFRDFVKREKGSNIVRQHNHLRLHKFSRWPESGPGLSSPSHLVIGGSKQYSNISKVDKRVIELHSRLPEQKGHNVHMANGPKSVLLSRQGLGSTRYGPLCLREVHDVPALQFPVFRPPFTGGGRSFPKRLGSLQQLGKPPVQTDSKNIGHPGPRAGSSYNYCAHVEGPRISPTSCKNVYRTSNQTSTSTQNLHTVGHSNARAHEKSSLEDFCLESAWQSSLGKLGWSATSIKGYTASLAPSSLVEYNKHIGEFYSFCLQRGVHSFHSLTAANCIPDFLCYRASRSERPESMLRSVSAALKHYFTAYSLYAPLDTYIPRLLTGLVKLETSRPRQRTKVMPIQPFIQMFLNWGENEQLSIPQLRTKAVTMLAISALCRPSDLAPSIGFRRSQVTFSSEGMVIVFFGIKNDTHREGFEVKVKSSTEVVTDPVSTLKSYLDRTKHLTDPVDGPVFLSLNAPYAQISPSTVAGILNDAIKGAGLESRGFTARCFRPSATERAYREGVPSDVIKQLGRWKSQNVMWDHYCSVSDTHNVTTSLLRDRPT